MTEIQKNQRGWEEILSDAIVALNAKDNSQWLLGDLGLEVENTFGPGMIEEFAIKIGVNKETIRRYKTVSKAWPKEWRKEFVTPDGDYCLSHRHFQLLAPREDRMQWARMAADNQWSCDALTVELMKEKGTYDKNTAIATMSFNSVEIGEILVWFNKIRENWPETLNETSYKVESKVNKFLAKAKQGGK